MMVWMQAHWIVHCRSVSTVYSTLHDWSPADSELEEWFSKLQSRSVMLSFLDTSSYAPLPTGIHCCHRHLHCNMDNPTDLDTAMSCSSFNLIATLSLSLSLSLAHIQVHVARGTPPPPWVPPPNATLMGHKPVLDASGRLVPWPAGPDPFSYL